MESFHRLRDLVRRSSTGRVALFMRPFYHSNACSEASERVSIAFSSDLAGGSLRALHVVRPARGQCAAMVRDS